MRIYKEIYGWEEFECYCKQNLWAGAKERWDNMTLEERQKLCEYVVMMGEDYTIESWSETQINDFIWFDWDIIKAEIEENG